MKATQSNKLRRFQTLEGVFERHEAIWSPLPASARTVAELAEIIPQITGAVQAQFGARNRTLRANHRTRGACEKRFGAETGWVVFPTPAS